MTRRPALLALLVLAALCAGGCYASRALWGGARLLAARRPVARLLADPATSPALRRQLEQARQLRAFAADELALPVGRSYSGYVELGRDYAAWTITAAPELSTEPVLWCFPIAGCVSYRGYFSQLRARRYAERLRRRGLDVDVGGVRAYSTLGWFRDPLLSSFIDLPEAELAALLFHELAHRRLWVKGDTVFNESFATVVEEEGVGRWLERHGRQEQLEAWLAARRRDREVTELVLAARERLAAAYAAAESDAWKRRRKDEILAGLAAAYRERRPEGGDRWDGFFGDGLNNARLASLGAYHQQAPALRRLLAEAGGDLERFYLAAEKLARLPPAQRRMRLASGLPLAAARPPG